ncbi:MAG: mucoidy inhibitor MuiA family protein [Bacteroidetes bacterium]|nr:MAG: mucoidy inhibitor MuiA family protein [Bacteroidota bacterium]
MRYQILIAALTMPIWVLAQNPDSSLKTINVQANLTAATVYYGAGAELNHSTKANLVTGIQQLVINNISLSANPKTLQVRCPEQVVLMSQKLQTYTPTQKWVPDALYKKMEDSVANLNKLMAVLQQELTTVQTIADKITALLKTADGSNGKDINSDNLIKLADYYEAKIEGLHKKQFDVQNRRGEAQLTAQAISTRMHQYAASQQLPNPPVGQLVLQIMASAPGPAEFGVSYFTPNAGWIASYDMRIKSTDNSFTLGYKASVQQTTGLHWKQTKLTLSTSNPNLSNTMPQLTAWYLQPQVQANFQKTKASMARADAQLLNEVVVVGYGNKNLNEDKDDEKPTEQPSYIDTYLTLNESQLNTNFDIDLPYDVPTDGKPYAVAIKQEAVQAAYKHYAVPKMDGDAFLVAELTNWEKLNLLPGEANIIMDNVYLGQSYINPNSTLDTLSIALGRDKRVSIKRTLVKDDNQNKTKGDNKYEYLTYELVVKNNKKQPLNLLLKDQYPMSYNKDIVVELEQHSNAEINKDLGVLNWSLTLAPGESKKIRFGYSIKYPKDMRLSIR